MGPVKRRAPAAGCHDPFVMPRRLPTCARTIFIFGALATAGLFTIDYLALAFILPVLPTREAWVAAMNEAS
jgi:hypothetical protein